MAPLADEIEALMPLGLEGLREVWRNRYGAPPKLRSAALLRHCLAWRLQAEALGGLDRDTRRQLKRRQRVQAEGLALGVGTTLQREWQGQIVQVTVEEEGFRHKGQLFKSLSAAATAIAGTRWNGPGLRSDKSALERSALLRSPIRQMSQPRLHCALYTRKSSEDGLEQAFNSLDAQREACAAYVKS